MTENVRQTWLRPSLVLAVASLVLHALANGHYGFFRDELYFIVCGDRPDWGYVDQPALVPLLASWSHALFADFLWGFRLLPMLVAAASVAATAEFAHVVGGSRFAQGLAGLCALLAPIFLLNGTLFFTDMFQPLSWLGLSWTLVRLERTGDERWWLAFGAIAGLSLNTKYLVAFYLLTLISGFCSRLGGFPWSVRGSGWGRCLQRFWCFPTSCGRPPMDGLSSSWARLARRTRTFPCRRWTSFCSSFF